MLARSRRREGIRFSVALAFMISVDLDGFLFLIQEGLPIHFHIPNAIFRPSTAGNLHFLTVEWKI